MGLVTKKPEVPKDWVGTKTNGLTVIRSEEVPGAE
jgi:hypothetical protein